MKTDLKISVIIPTHNPHQGRLSRTLIGLRDQTLPSAEWETVLVDNASYSAITTEVLSPNAPPNLRVVKETNLGLTAARRRGFTEAKAPIYVLVDDDNVLAPDYLAEVWKLLAKNETLGAIGGKSLPEFEAPPPSWSEEFFPLLALRDGGNASNFATGLRETTGARNRYPSLAAPIGAGMAIRRAALTNWLDTSDSLKPTDRKGQELTSGGDNDIVFSVLSGGWSVGYCPELLLTHLIPEGRLKPDYLGRLNYGIQKSWVQVLHRYSACPWAPIPSWSLPLRKVKAWFKYRAWSSSAAHIRWQGACGHFDGRQYLSN